jgi:hypothetical protein
VAVLVNGLFASYTLTRTLPSLSNSELSDAVGVVFDKGLECLIKATELLLRARLVKVRVRMVSYVFSYEKAVSDRPFRH